MIFKDTPKFVVNLKRRTDRLESIQKEMNYINWDFEYFSAIDTNSHVGCSLSHIEIIKLAKARKYEKVMVIEDDCIIMPYVKSLVDIIEKDTHNFNFAIVNLSPTLNRPVELSKEHKWFLDITNLPPKQEYHRGIFATNMIMYHESIYDKLLELEEHSKLNYYAIDDYIYQFISSFHQSYTPILPIGPQISSWSDVSQGVYNNFYTQTYNWNIYSPIKIPKSYLDLDYLRKIKNENLHEEIKYEN